MTCIPYVTTDRAIRVVLSERTERGATHEFEKRLVAVIVVAPNEPELFDELRGRYTDREDVRVIMDRRSELADPTADHDRRHDRNLWIEGYLVVPPRETAGG
jgi:hypothetical protein